jgi:hypothetical protein
VLDDDHAGAHQIGSRIFFFEARTYPQDLIIGQPLVFARIDADVVELLGARVHSDGPNVAERFVWQADPAL